MSISPVHPTAGWSRPWRVLEASSAALSTALTSSPSDSRRAASRSGGGGALFPGHLVFPGGHERSLGIALFFFYTAEERRNTTRNDATPDGVPEEVLLGDDPAGTAKTIARPLRRFINLFFLAAAAAAEDAEE